MAVGSTGLAAGATTARTVLICTPTGYKLVTIADLPPGDGSPAPLPLKEHFCPLCQAVKSAAALPPPAPPELCAPVVAASVVRAPIEIALPAAPALANLQARAPPPIA